MSIQTLANINEYTNIKQTHGNINVCTNSW